MIEEAESVAEPGLRRRLRRALKGLLRSPLVLNGAGRLIAAYLGFVHRTSRTVFVTGGMNEAVGGRYPVILSAWHGQTLLAPFTRSRDVDLRALVSRHLDGEVGAVSLARMGIGLIRGSGGRDRRADRGGAQGLRELLRALKGGASVFMTADINNTVARRAGLGIVTLAKLSGRPIVPVCYATRGRVRIEGAWDKATIPLPFSRGAVVFGDFVEVPRDADEELMEQKRQQVEKALNAAFERAYAFVDKHNG